MIWNAVRSLKNFAKSRNFVDLEYIYGKLSNQGGEYPLDFRAAIENPASFKIVATNAMTGITILFILKITSFTIQLTDPIIIRFKQVHVNLISCDLHGFLHAFPRRKNTTKKPDFSVLEKSGS